MNEATSLFLGAPKDLLHKTLIRCSKRRISWEVAFHLWNTRGDYWVLTLAGAKLQKLGGNAPASTLMFAKFSPDGRSVAYVRENNMYVEDLATCMWKIWRPERCGH